MATCPTVQAIYTELIKTIVLRNSDGINIPKYVRERAFTLAVDIVITSVPREVYKNYSTTPAEGFYGNATLVMQDCLERKIPVNMPRQRLYYGRVPEAFEMWQALIDWSYFQSYMTAIGESLASLGTALGVSFVPSEGCCALPDRAWIELPLREVYFKCPKGTQYEIEVSWYTPDKIADACGNLRDPKSKQKDGDKDKGLPPNGTQPSTAPNPNNPFDGLPNGTSDADQGDFSNSKGEDRTGNPSPLDNTDPDNVPNLGAFAHINTRYWDSSTACHLKISNSYWLGNTADEFSLVKTGEAGECGQTTGFFNLIGSISGVIASGFPSVGDGITVTKELHSSKPPNTVDDA